MKQILGTMTFGDQVDQDSAQDLIEQFSAAGNRELDTAHIYCEGKTEEMLGKLFPCYPAAISISPPRSIRGMMRAFSRNG